MKNKGVFTIAIVSLVLFMGIASYLWYLYFHDYENALISENPKMEFLKGVELVNTGNIDYVNAKTEDNDSIIPIYYFSVKSKSNKDFNYNIVILDSEGNDDCSSSTRLNRNELEYELKLDNKVIKSGGLDTLANNILDDNIIKAGSVNDYSLKIKLKDTTTDYENKHFHYVINMKEKE